MSKPNHQRLRGVLSQVKAKALPKDFPKAFHAVIWELMRTQTDLTKFKEIMDKKMHKITQSMKMAEKDMKGGKKKTAVKVLKKAESKNETLVKMDKKRDKVIKKAKMGKC